LTHEFNIGDQVWYVNKGDYHWGIPTVEAGTIESLLVEGKYYGFGAMHVAKASSTYSDPKDALPEVAEILKGKIVRAEEKLGEMKKYLEELENTIR